MRTAARILLLTLALLAAGLAALELARAHAQGPPAPPRPELKPRPDAVPVPVPEVEVHVQRGQRFDYQRMSELYFATCTAVAKRAHPEWSLARQSWHLRPHLRLYVGAKTDSIQVDPAGDHYVFIVRLRRWDERRFVAAVVDAATDALLSRQQKNMVLLEVLGEPPPGTITVERLRKEQEW